MPCQQPQRSLSRAFFCSHNIEQTMPFNVRINLLGLNPKNFIIHRYLQQSTTRPKWVRKS